MSCIKGHYVPCIFMPNKYCNALYCVVIINGIRNNTDVLGQNVPLHVIYPFVS